MAGLALQCVVVWEEELAAALVVVSVEEWEVVSLAAVEVFL